MFPPEDVGGDADRRAFIASARERIAARKEEIERAGHEGPDAGSTFEERYEHLLRELAELYEPLSELEVEAHGPLGLRIRFPPTEREVRITSLEEQGFVHFVFGHSTLGTLHRAEHHAARPFGDRAPDVPKLARQILGFLVEGTEPRWLARRPAREEASPSAEPPDDDVLELPLD